MLNIHITEKDRPIIARMKKTLLNRFRPNSENDIQLAIRLAHYLFAMGDVESSKALLESFLYYDERDKEEPCQHLWFDNCYGISLLAYIIDERLDKLSVLLNDELLNNK